MSNILMLYASVTGNTELMAESMIDYLKQHHYDVDIKVFDEDKIDVTDLMNYKGVLMGVYTWTDGELPFEVEGFYDDLESVDLTGKVCGVFGSGDQFYDHFCGAVDLIYERLEESGATMIPFKVKVDMDPEEEEIRQCEQLVEAVIRQVKELKQV